MLARDLTDWITTFNKVDNYIICSRCDDICALVRVRVADRMLIRIKCRCNQLMFLPANVPAVLKATLLTLTPMNLITALHRSYTADCLPSHHAIERTIKYIIVTK
jgi:hypothetical protein